MSPDSRKKILTLKKGAEHRKKWKRRQAKGTDVFLSATWLHKNLLLFSLLSAALYSTVNDELAIQAAAWRTFWPLSPSSAEANIHRFKLSLYCSIYQPRLRSQMWGENLLDRKRGEATNLAFLGQRLSKRFVPSLPKPKGNTKL